MIAAAEYVSRRTRHAKQLRWPDAVLAIPAVLASGLFSLPDAFKPTSGDMSAAGPQLAVAVLIAFVVGLAAIAWLLRFLVHHRVYWFVGYRVVVGAVVMALLGRRVVAAT